MIRCPDFNIYEMLTVNRLGLPLKLRRSLACTNSIENMMGTVRRVCRNVKRWRNAAMALRWTAAGMLLPSIESLQVSARSHSRACAQYDVDAAIAARSVVLVSLIADVTRAYLDLRSLRLNAASPRKAALNQNPIPLSKTVNAA